jgi:hypothetical protein
MGIKILCDDIRSVVRACLDAREPAEASVRTAVCFDEPKYDQSTRSASYARANFVVVDFMLHIYSAKRPLERESGASLVAHIFATLVRPALEARQTLALVFDNSQKVPSCKAATQMKRRRTKPRVPEDLPIGDDCELEYKDWYNLLATSSVRARLMEYVLHGLSRAISQFTEGAEECYGIVYASAPWRRTCSYGEPRLVSGAFLELTHRGAPLPPESAQGEGDLLCKVFSDFLFEQPGNETGVVASKDLDMLGIYACTPSKGRVLLHITTKDLGGRRHYGFVDVCVLWRHVFQNSALRGMHFALALVLAGSDFCEGVRGIDGLRILRAALGLRPAADPAKRSNPAQPVFFDDARLMVTGDSDHPCIRQKRMERILSTASSRPGFVFTQPYMLRRASWNILYWSNLGHIPSPEKAAAWGKDVKGAYMPIEDICRKRKR